MNTLRLYFSTAAESEAIPINAESITMADMFTPRPTLRMEEETAIISITGSLARQVPAVMEKVGSQTAYTTISAEIAQARENGAERFRFEFDSPGGSVIGCQECAEEIAAISEPTQAHALGMMTSGAYFLAAGCDLVTAGPSAVVGGVGVVTAMEDTGEKVTVWTNEGADLKGATVGELTAEQEEFLMGRINAVAKTFHNHVGSHRGLNAEVMRGGHYSGSDALSLGLVDSIGTI